MTRSNRLSGTVPDDYDAPSGGWKEPARAVPVTLDTSSVLAEDLDKKGSLRIFRSFNGVNGDRYEALRGLVARGPELLIDYGQVGDTDAENGFMQSCNRLGAVLGI
jgi:hypothetical protein